jgi:hypothetical protein
MIVYSLELVSATGTKIIPSQCRNLGVFIDLIQKAIWAEMQPVAPRGRLLANEKHLAASESISLIWFTSTCAAGLIMLYNSIAHIFLTRFCISFTVACISPVKKFPCTRHTRTAKIVPRRSLDDIERRNWVCSSDVIASQSSPLRIDIISRSEKKAPPTTFTRRDLSRAHHLCYKSRRFCNKFVCGRDSQLVISAAKAALRYIMCRWMRRFAVCASGRCSLCIAKRRNLFSL